MLLIYQLTIFHQENEAKKEKGQKRKAEEPGMPLHFIIFLFQNLKSQCPAKWTFYSDVVQDITESHQKFLFLAIEVFVVVKSWAMAS